MSTSRQQAAPGVGREVAFAWLLGRLYLRGCVFDRMTMHRPVKRGQDGNHGYDEFVPIRVLLVSDHALLREGLMRILQDDPATEVVGAYTSVLEAATAAQNGCCDVVVAEARVSDGTAADVARHLQDVVSPARVIMLCVGDDEEDLSGAVAAGVKGVLDRGTDATGLVGCIRSVTLGQFSVSDRLAGRMAADLAVVRERGSRFPAQDTVLTERELEILDLVVAGLTNRGIAERLFLSESTIRAHIRSIMQKLNVENRVQAATFALRNNLASRPAPIPAFLGRPQN